jgi:hypothetical protein
MKMWQQTAQQLPVQVRPVRGETTISYIFRLADVNDLARPTILLGALGRPTKGLTRYQINEYDVRLNQPALQRLETFTGTPAAHLKTIMPGLHRLDDTLPTDIPAIRLFRAWNLHDHCNHCTARLPGRQPAKVYTLYFPVLCRKHRRWLATNTDLTDTPEIITAHRRYGRLLATGGDRDWTYQQLHDASWIVGQWASHSDRGIPRLHDRWQARSKVLDNGRRGPASLSRLLVYPEAVALTEVFCDLEWRRHVAMVREPQMTNFFRHVTKRLNQPPDFADWLERPWTRQLHRRYDWISNPLQQWIYQLRRTHQQIRTDFYAQHNGLTHTPFPEIRHFK